MQNKIPMNLTNANAYLKSLNCKFWSLKRNNYNTGGFEHINPLKHSNYEHFFTWQIHNAKTYSRLTIGYILFLESNKKNN